MTRYEEAKKIIESNYLKTNIGKVASVNSIRGRYNQGMKGALKLLKPLLK